jgi:hypothetical protein
MQPVTGRTDEKVLMTDRVAQTSRDERRFAAGVDLIRLVVPFRIWSNLDMIDRSKVKLGEPLPGYRFKPGECIVNSDFADKFRQGICTQKELDDLKMLVVEAGIDRITQNEDYRLLYYSIAGGDDIPWNQFHRVEVPAAYVTGSQPTPTNLFQIALAVEPIQRRT